MRKNFDVCTFSGETTEEAIEKLWAVLPDVVIGRFTSQLAYLNSCKQADADSDIEPTREFEKLA